MEEHMLCKNGWIPPDEPEDDRSWRKPPEKKSELTRMGISLSVAIVLVGGFCFGLLKLSAYGTRTMVERFDAQAIVQPLRSP